jgi:hypothetical protein
MNDSLKAAVLQAAGFTLALASIGFCVWLFPDSKIALAVGALGLVNWFIGKLTGIPFQTITMQAIKSLPPAKAKEAVRILSMRPIPNNVAIQWENDDEKATPAEFHKRKLRGPDSGMDS